MTLWERRINGSGLGKTIPPSLTRPFRCATSVDVPTLAVFMITIDGDKERVEVHRLSQRWTEFCLPRHCSCSSVFSVRGIGFH